MAKKQPLLPVSHLDIYFTPLFEVFFGPKGQPKFLPINCFFFEKKTFDQGFALVYIDDILLLAHTKNHMLDSMEQLHQTCSSNNLKLAPENSFFILLTVNFLGHEIGNYTIKPMSSKVDGLHKLRTPTSKTELMHFIGSKTFCSKFMYKLHILFKPFIALLHDDISFEWSLDLGKLYNEIKTSLSKDAQLAIPNTNHPFNITVDDPLTGLNKCNTI